MKTKISVNLLKQGMMNDELLKAIASHNAGECILCPEDFISFANFKRAMYPTLYKKTLDIRLMQGTTNSLEVTEDNGETFTMHIGFMNIFELTQNGETDPDDLKGLYETPETDKP